MKQTGKRSPFADSDSNVAVCTPRKDALLTGRHAATGITPGNASALTQSGSASHGLAGQSDVLEGKTAGAHALYDLAADQVPKTDRAARLEVQGRKSWHHRPMTP